MVCATKEWYARYIAGAGNYRLLAGISTALIKETLLLCLIENVNVANTTSRNRHYGINPESLLDKRRIGLNTAWATLNITTL